MLAHAGVRRHLHCSDLHQSLSACLHGMCIALRLVSRTTQVVMLSLVTTQGIRHPGSGPGLMVHVIASCLPDTKKTLKPQKSGYPPDPKDPAAQAPDPALPPSRSVCFLERGAAGKLLFFCTKICSVTAISVTLLLRVARRPLREMHREVSDLNPE